MTDQEKETAMDLVKLRAAIDDTDRRLLRLLDDRLPGRVPGRARGVGRAGGPHT